MAYQRPMVTVDQNMTTTPTSLERDQPAFVFGPNYELHRYSESDEKEGTLVGTYDRFSLNGKSMNVPFPGVIDAEAVDKGFTKLHGDNVVVQLADLTSGDSDFATLPEVDVPTAVRDENGGYTKLFFPGKRFVRRAVDGTTGERDIVPQDIVVGDQLLVTYIDAVGGNVPTRIRSKVTAAIYVTGPYDIDKYEDSGDSDPEITVAGTLITIEDAIPESANVDKVKAVLVGVFNGLEFTAKNFALAEAGYTEPGYQWEQPSNKITGSDGSKFYGVRINDLYAFVSDYFNSSFEDEDDPQYCKVLFADLYVTYRELITSYADTLHSLTGSTEVASLLGKVTPDNPLAMGVHMAALNSTTDDGTEAPPVYFMAVPSDDADGYDAVLNKATLTDKVYILSPTTRDKDVLEKVRSHCLDMSTKTVKQWRIAAASAEIPATVDRLNAAMDAQGDDFLAIPVSSEGGVAVSDDATYNMLRIVKAMDDISGSQDTSLRSTVVVGDHVRFGYHTNPWGEETFDTYVVKRVINNYTVEVAMDDSDDTDDDIDCVHLVPADGNAHYTPSKIEIYHTYTAAETAEVVESVSKAMASRRMLNVFPPVFKMDGVTMTGEFAACAVAGLVSATEPQQPITNVTVRGIDDIPMAYQTFNKTQLDTMAAGGTFIIAQDLPNDLVYVRHQITTAYPDGNLNTAELSITKNVDDISYKFAETFRPYYGKFNIIPGLIGIVHNKAEDLIDELGRDDSVYGPQLILGEGETEILDISQNKLMKDHLNVKIRLSVPYPCNNIDIELIV